MTRNQKQILNDLDEMQKGLHVVLDLTEYLLEEYGKCAVVSGQQNLEDCLHDYSIFCVAKSRKTISAIDLLLTNNHPEDALVLCRSVYESYLHLAFIYKNPEKINELVAAKVGSYMGIYEHPKSKKGKPIWDKIVSPDGEVVGLGVPLIEMASHTGFHYDESVHIPFYSLLSEYCHSHFITAESYMDEAKEMFAVVQSFHNIFQATIYSLYVSFLLLQGLVRYKYIVKSDQEKIDTLTSIMSELLVSNIEKTEHTDETKVLKLAILERLGEQYA